MVCGLEKSLRFFYSNVCLHWFLGCQESLVRSTLRKKKFQNVEVRLLSIFSLPRQKQDIRALNNMFELLCAVYSISDAITSWVCMEGGIMNLLILFSNYLLFFYHFLLRKCLPLFHTHNSWELEEVQIKLAFPCFLMSVTGIIVLCFVRVWCLPIHWGLSLGVKSPRSHLPWLE